MKILETAQFSHLRMLEAYAWGATHRPIKQHDDDLAQEEHARAVAQMRVAVVCGLGHYLRVRVSSTRR